MESTSTESTRSTYDLFLAAHLQAHGFKVVSTRRISPYRNTFIFEYSAALDQEIQEYYGRNDTTRSLDLADHYRALKSLIKGMQAVNSDRGGDR